MSLGVEVREGVSVYVTNTLHFNCLISGSHKKRTQMYLHTFVKIKIGNTASLQQSVSQLSGLYLPKNVHLAQTQLLKEKIFFLIFLFSYNTQCQHILESTFLRFLNLKEVFYLSISVDRFVFQSDLTTIVCALPDKNQSHREQNSGIGAQTEKYSPGLNRETGEGRPVTV